MKNYRLFLLSQYHLFEKLIYKEPELITDNNNLNDQIPTFRENILLIHLGMSGQIKIRANKNHLSKHDHFRMIIETSEKKKIFGYLQ